jgi:Reverse transcriptase (RNA-dependent DNA polymerase)
MGLIIVLIMTMMIWYEWWKVTKEEIWAKNNEKPKQYTWLERVTKWWIANTRKTKWERTKITTCRYYVYGNRYRMAKNCYKRTKNTVRASRSMYRTPTCLLTEVDGAIDSSWLGIDTLSTYCLTNDMNDFVGSTEPMDAKIVGVSNDQAKIFKKGKGVFRIQDDKGVQCNLYLPELFYCPTVPYKVLSPQHVDATWRKYNLGIFSEATDSRGTLILWQYQNGTKHTKRIKHTTKSGIPLCHTAPSYEKYKKFLRTEGQYQEDDRKLINMLAGTELRVENPYYTEQSAVKTGTVPESSKNIFKEPATVSTTPLVQVEGETPQQMEVGAKHENKDDEEQKQSEDIFMDTEIANTDTEDVVAIPVKNRTEQDIKSEKLLIHYKLGHLPFSAINQMASNGELPSRLTKVGDPMCASCIFGQSTRKAWRTKSPPNQVTPRKIEKPGDCISLDQMESPIPGHIAQMKGSPTRERYNAATIFVDHFSDITFVHLQKSTNAEETIEAKEAFERWASSHGVNIRHYHADNGRFAETAFMAHVAKRGQTISFCGVNAHFQNGKAERRIRTLQDLARTQMLHAKARWPVAITEHLWPYAITNVANMHNDVPRMGTKRSRTELFAGVDVRPNLKNHHHFGIPVYVLDNSMQAGRKIPKWMPRARVGIYLGKSPRHAGNVSLVLNPRTGMVSPQFHMKYDETFETVRGIREESHGTWRQKCGFTREQPRDSPLIPKTEIVEDSANLPPTLNEAASISPDFGDTNDETIRQLETPIAQADGKQQSEGAAGTPELNDKQDTTTRRSNRTWKPTSKYLESIEQEAIALPANVQIANYDVEYKTILDDVNPFTVLAKTDGDTMYWDQALKQHDSAQFIEAAINEIATHQENGHWVLIPKSDIPSGTPVLDAVWSMKRKRRLLTNEVYKHKARLNVHGGQQEYGLNYWETYAPVVTWAAIRIILVLVLMYDWHTKQIDFVLAYPQANVECDIYMKIPRDFAIEGKTRDTHVLKLVKNLYGQKQAGRVWNQHLHDTLIKLGWRQSKADDCLYYKGNVLFLVYVDDGILVSPSSESLETELGIMQQEFKISVEGSLSDYVGVNIERTTDGKIHMSQPNIIRSILSDLNYTNDTKSQSTPAYSTNVLKDGKELEAHKADWNYRRVIGKLNFLCASCRPDIACAVHQCARFTADPRINHTEAVKRIGRYLIGTADKGIIFDPTKHSFEVYVDADFGGLWDSKTAADKPVTAKSRTGYVIMYAGCPIVWASQLQSEFALSTTEAEYLAMSTALRNTIPLMRLVRELQKQLKLPMEVTPTVRCTVFEDNSGAVELAKVPKMRPRTKHINVKYHHFRKYVYENIIKVIQVTTTEQLADIFTKNLARDLFLYFRKKIMGW